MVSLPRIIPVDSAAPGLRPVACVILTAAAVLSAGAVHAGPYDKGGLATDMDALGRSLGDALGFNVPAPAADPADPVAKSLPAAPAETMPADPESTTPVSAQPSRRADPMPVISADEGVALNALLSEDTPMPDYTGLPGMNGLAVVVELFTSQGCANCPPADAMMAALDSQPDVLPLTFHVDYWDYLGWADSFAQPQFTDRQQLYAYASGERALYTPQVIVDGQDTALSLRPAELMAMVDAHRASPALLSVAADKLPDGRRTVELQPLSDVGGPLAVTLVHYLPSRQVNVAGGENAGRTITYRNVVIGMERLAVWPGTQALRVNFNKVDHSRAEQLPKDARNALLIQQLRGGRQLPGPIIGALRLE